MKRRIASLILAVLLLLPTGAAMAVTTPVAITSEDVQGNVGDTVSVTLNIVIEPPKVDETMDSLQFLLVYDSSALEFVGIQEVSQGSIDILGVKYLCDVSANTGKVGFTAATTRGCPKGSGVLMHVRFKILSPVSTMLTLKNVAYSFVTKNGATQDRKQGGTINLRYVTGKSAPTTIPPSSLLPTNTPDDSSPTPDAGVTPPPFIVTESTNSPDKAETTPEPEKESNDILAYIVFVLFIVVAILVCVVLTLMIVRRGRNKARVKYFEDDEDDEPLPSAVPEEDEKPYRETHIEDEEPYREAPPEGEEDEDDPPIQIVRRGKR